MICINPMAPCGETAPSSPPLSAVNTALIQGAGTPNRCAASWTKLAKGSMTGVLLDCVATTGSAYTAPANPVIDNASRIKAIDIANWVAICRTLTGTEDGSRRRSNSRTAD